MNRSLWVPAIGCVVGFASLYALLNRAVGEGQAPEALAVATSGAPSAPREPLAASESERVLASLCDAYRERWRAWETSPHRLFSRVAPQSIAPRTIEFALSPKSTGDDAFTLAAIVVHQRGQTRTIPCVADPLTKQVRLFHEGSWLTGDEWLQTAPATPRDARVFSERLRRSE